MNEPSSNHERARKLAQLLRLRGPLQSDPTARMLHALVLALAVWYGVWTLILLPLYPNPTAKLPAVFLQEAGPVAALILLRGGRLRQASITYLAGTWLFATFVIAHNGGIRSPILVYYATLPILATWLLGFRGAMWTGGLCLGSALLFALMAIFGEPVSRTIQVTPFGIWAVLLQVILIGAVPVAQVLRALGSALAQSRQAEQELEKYKQHLERLVDERTAELVQARDQALAANRAKGVFLAHMSHELRTPLNAILGFSKMVLRDPALPHQHRRDLAVVDSSGEHLLALIDDVLDTAKIESGGATLEVTTFDLRDLVDDIAGMLRERAGSKNLDLLVDINPKSPQFIRSDPGKLRQILTNLVGNAVKYTDQGTVSLAVESRPVGGSDTLCLIFEVRDTGIGIHPDDLDRIFDPFVQAETARSRKGVGLGLSITRQFITLLGGTIHVESEPGRGSRFRVEIVARPGRADEVKPKVPAGEDAVRLKPGQPECRVLIVEDQKENWLLLERLLQAAGFHTRVAVDGGHAVGIFESWRPNFIWMDLRIPVLSGVEATQRIRKLPGGRDVKIAAVTASVFASQREEILAAGFDDFMRKPYRPREIFDCMARHLGVEYAHEPGQKSTATALPTIVSPEALSSVSPALLEHLERALVSLDQDRVRQAIRDIAERKPALGKALEGLAEITAYTPILHALETCRKGLVNQ